MYLAPLNYDLFFKKVFSDLDVSKQFLEDLLEISIESIEGLKTSRRVTDASASVEFDFRCKINGSYVIVDMQQWYKPDVAHRFYLYHTLGTSLQLEDLPLKALVTSKDSDKVQKHRDYRAVEPVLTVVWMVDDVLGNTDDILSYRMYPEDVAYFLRNSDLWDQPEIKALLEERTRVLEKLDNKTKSLDFIQANRLLFAFQKNIVQNQKLKPYIRWFELAAKTKHPQNKKEDFETFEQDEAFNPIYQRIKERLIRDNLPTDEKQYIEDEASKQALIQRTIDGYVDELSGEMEMMREKLEARDHTIEQKDQMLEENKKVLEEKDRALDRALQALIDQGFSEAEAKKLLGSDDE